MDTRDDRVPRSWGHPLLQHPIGDYCELLVAAHFGVTPIGGSNKGYDLMRDDDVRVQVKGRRVTAESPTVGHWSVIHQLVEHSFDEVVAIVVNEDFSVREAWTVPWQAADRLKRWNKANNGYVLPYTQAFLNDDEVTPLDLRIPGSTPA